MKLYTNNQGQWVGTQADAKKLSGKAVQVEVPVSKPELLSFLNEKMVQYDLNQHIETFRSQPDPQKNSPQTIGDLEQESSCPEPSLIAKWSGKTTRYDIKDAAQNASLKDLGVALAVYMTRVDEELYK